MMTSKELDTFCDLLNGEAIALRDEKGLDDQTALIHTAWAHDLSQLTTTVDDYGNTCPCVIWETPDGTRLNMWLDSPGGSEIEEGGLGFDDQTDWYEG